MRRVGLIGAPEREEIVRLAIRLEERGAEPVVFDASADPGIEMGPGECRLQGIDLAGFSGFYVSDLGIRTPWRRSDSGGLDEEATRRALTASKRHLAAWNALLIRQSKTARVANPPHTHDLHGLKPWEMSVYDRLDIPVPWTLATSSPERLVALSGHESMPPLVRKGLVGGYGFTEAFELPTRVEAASALGGAIQIQERIEGDNLRVFVLGGQVLGGATIYSKDPGATDNRRGDIRVQRITVPDETARVAKRAAKHWRLAFTAVDFMRDAASGRDLMLECNSSPFFVGFERSTGIDVASALADYLLARGAYRD
ncbi:MAG: hypothetical protein RL885_07400 [Planctomycetota bacterium]